MADDEEGLHFESNMDDLVDRLQEKVLYMRTTDLKVCSTNHFIHGMRIALKHDYTKDPEHNSKLDNFYSSETTIVSDHSQRFYEHYVGSQEGNCKNVHLERGERIIQIAIKYDTIIRHITVKKSDGTIIELGEEDPYNMKLYKTKILNFPNGEEIVGVYGMIEKDKKKSDGVANHFVSMGFITNQCKTENL